MATFSEAFDEGVQTAFCEALPTAISGGLLFAGLTATTGLGAAGGIATAAGAAIAYATFCNREMPYEDFPQPPFVGGQCPTAYDLVVSLTRQDPGDIPRQYVENVPLVRGKVGGLGVDNPGGATRLYVIGGLEGNPNAQARYNVQTVGLPGQPQPIFSNFSITSIVRRDGQPDNCGSVDPVPPVVPPGSNIVNQPITYNNYQGDTINNDFTFAFGYAQFNANGTLNVPVSVRNNINPELNFSGTVNLNSGDFNVNIGNPSNPVGGGGDSFPDAVPPEDTPPLPDDLPPSEPLPPGEPEQPERRKILRGCLVTTTIVPQSQSVIFQTDNPDIYVPDLGFVSFLVQVGNRTGWTQQIKVNNKRQIIECPWVNGAIDVRGTPRPNCEFTVTPLYTIQTFNPTYPPEA